jgi:transposase-like protein
MECPKCGAEQKVKNGFMKGLQRYKCKGCRCNYTKSAQRGYPLSVRRKVIKYYLEGIGFRRIERLLGKSNVTVLYWVRDLGHKVREYAESQPKKDEKIIELDELCAYVKKNEIQLGFGHALREIPKKYWPVMLESVRK